MLFTTPRVGGHKLLMPRAEVILLLFRRAVLLVVLDFIDTEAEHQLRRTTGLCMASNSLETANALLLNHEQTAIFSH